MRRRGEFKQAAAASRRNRSEQKKPTPEQDARRPARVVALPMRQPRGVGTEGEAASSAAVAPVAAGLIARLKHGVDHVDDAVVHLNVGGDHRRGFVIGVHDNTIINVECQEVTL